MTKGVTSVLLSGSSDGYGLVRTAKAFSYLSSFVCSSYRLEFKSAYKVVCSASTLLLWVRVSATSSNAIKVCLTRSSESSHLRVNVGCSVNGVCTDSICSGLTSLSVVTVRSVCFVPLIPLYAIAFLVACFLNSLESRLSSSFKDSGT